MTEKEALKQASDALTATDAATTKASQVVDAIQTGVATLLQRIIDSDNMTEINALAAQALALNAKSEALVPVLEGIAASVANPVPVPVPETPANV